jgi:hypothetical protein
MIKWILIALLLGLGFAAYAQENYTIYKRLAPTGERLISLRSNVNYHAYCHILDGNGYLVADFYLNPYQNSRWYYEPYGRWTWRCE